MLFQFIVLQILVFGAVIFFLKKIFYGDTESAINRLGSVHQDLLQKQAELQQKNDAIEKELAAKREEAATVVDKLRMETAAEIQKKEDAVLKNARAQAEEIIAKAQGSQEDMAKEIESKLSKKMLGFAAEIVKKAFNEQLVQSIHEELVLEFISKAKQMDFSNSGGGSADEFIVRSPIALKKEEIEKINALLASKASRVVKFNEVRDADLIAGVVLQFGTLVLDGSLTSLLNHAVEKARETY